MRAAVVSGERISESEPEPPARYRSEEDALNLGGFVACP